MARFVTLLQVELVNDADGTWRLLERLVYASDILPRIVVPAGFVTDFASVPRLPLAFLLAGGTCHQAAVIHDWLYACQDIDRATADAVLREACEASGVPGWRRWLVWAGVRVGGWVGWRRAQEAAA